MLLSFDWTIPSWGIYGAIAFFIIGLVLIIKGGDFFVDASVWVADTLRIPKFIVGATIVSLATTMPELLVSIFATIKGDAGIAAGNALGSVTANTGLILALSALFLAPSVDRKSFGIKGAMILFTALVMFGFTFFQWGGEPHYFNWIPSVILILVLVFHIYNLIIEGKPKKNQIADDTSTEETKEEVKEPVEKPNAKTIIINILKFVIGAAGIVIGAQLLVGNGKAIATACHISEGIIGITIVAIGTSLPELVTTITAIRKKQGELGVGNILGANLIDLCLILPICSFISGKYGAEISAQGYILDIPALFIISAIGIIPTIIKKKFSRWQGIVMLLLYVAYIVLAAIFFI